MYKSKSSNTHNLRTNVLSYKTTLLYANQHNALINPLVGVKYINLMDAVNENYKIKKSS